MQRLRVPSLYQQWVRKAFTRLPSLWFYYSRGALIFLHGLQVPSLHQHCVREGIYYNGDGVISLLASHSFLLGYLWTWMSSSNHWGHTTVEKLTAFDLCMFDYCLFSLIISDSFNLEFQLLVYTCTHTISKENILYSEVTLILNLLCMYALVNAWKIVNILVQLRVKCLLEFVVSELFSLQFLFLSRLFNQDFIPYGYVCYFKC